MFKLRTLFVLIIIYLVAFVSIKYNIDLFYPYHLVKNYLLMPVIASSSNKDISMSDNYNEVLINEMKDDINELKELTKIKTILSTYHVINATVIERNRNYWFNTMMIDKGKKEGIEEKMAVVSANGLIGKISKVYPHMSEIKLITTSDLSDKTSVLIDSENKAYGIIESYQNNYLEVTLTSKNNSVKVGDRVSTTGMGGVYPSGILIGKVVDKKKNKYDIGEILIVEPASNFNKIKYVGVLVRD